MCCPQLVVYFWRGVSIKSQIFSLSSNRLVSSSWISFLFFSTSKLTWFDSQGSSTTATLHAADVLWTRGPKIPCEHVEIKRSCASLCFVPPEPQIYFHYNYFSPRIHLCITQGVRLSRPTSFLRLCAKGSAAQFWVQPMKFCLFLQSLWTNTTTFWEMGQTLTPVYIKFCFWPHLKAWRVRFRSIQQQENLILIPHQGFFF